MKTKEITIIDRVTSLETTSGLALEFGVQELNKLAERAKAIESATNPQLKEVKKELVAKRNYIKKYCLDARREIKKVAEEVSEVEGMLLDIFVGEEKRLDELAEVARKAKEREERKALLPQRIARLQAVWGEGHNHGVTEEELLAMDGSTFEGLVNRMTAEKLEADRAEIARQQAEIDRQREEQRKEQERLDWEAKSAERAELARQEERERMEREQKEKEEREAQEKKEAEAKAERDRLAQEQAEIDRKAKLEADQRYQAWLTSHGYEGEGQGQILRDMGDHVLKFVDKFDK